MKKVNFLTVLDLLTVEGRIDLDVGFEGRLKLTNNVKAVKKLITPKQAQCIGLLEYQHLLSGRPVLYSIRECDDELMINDMLLDFLRDVQSFLAEIWMLQDNSVNCQQGFAFWQKPDHAAVNCLPVYNSDSYGADINLKLSADAIESMVKSPLVLVFAVHEQEIPTQTSLRKSRGRVNVAMVHLQAARNYRDLGFKISCYCSLFEAIFSVDTVELAHQLSERLAFFIGDTAEERLELYKRTKKAYGVRSKAVHGDVLDKSISELSELSNHCDQIARKALHKIFSDANRFDLFNSGSNEALHAYLLGLVFSGKSISNT